MMDSQMLLAEIAAPGPSDALSIWWLGQMGFIIKSGSSVIVIDAFLSEHPRREIPPPLKPSELQDATLFIGTHDHKDHIDRDAWSEMGEAAPSAPFIIPRAVLSRLEEALPALSSRYVGMNDGEKIQISDVTLSAVASAHEFLDRDEASGLYPYLGFIIEVNGFRLYHPGDTCLYNGLENRLLDLGPYDLMILPINGRDALRYSTGYLGCMTYQEAADLAGTLSPRVVIPGHYDMFKHNGENPLLFMEYVAAKYPKQQVHLASHGVKYSLRRSS